MYISILSGKLVVALIEEQADERITFALALQERVRVYLPKVIKPDVRRHVVMLDQRFHLIDEGCDESSR